MLILSFDREDIADAPSLSRRKDANSQPRALRKVSDFKSIKKEGC